MFTAFRYEVRRRFFVFRYSCRRFLRRITPLTWLLWIALISDFCAPGYLVFHVGVKEVDASVVLEEVLAVWKVAIDAPDH